MHACKHVLRQRKMVWRGLRNEIWGIVLCIVVGLMVGAVSLISSRAILWLHLVLTTAPRF